MATASRTVTACVCPLDCPDTCRMLVTVDDGLAVDLRGDPDHAFTRGFLCQKMARYLDRVYSPERLLRPLRRGCPLGRRAAGDPPVQLLWHDGEAAGEQPRPAVLPPAGGVDPRPDDLRVGRHARL